MMRDTESSRHDLQRFDLWEVVPDPPRDCCQDWRQTGTCDDSQADGVPCDRPDGQCEVCGRSSLDRAVPWRR